jgi:predicted Zn-dependent protease
MRSIQYILAILCTALLAAGESCVASSRQSKRSPSDADINLVGQRTLRRSINAISTDLEMKEGKAMAQELGRSYHMIDDPLVTEYVNGLAQLLAENSDVQIPITVQISNSANPNAIFLPGGHWIISSSLILETENEAELAGIFAHGIAHTALRNEFGKMTKNDVAQMEMIPAILMTNWVEPLGQWGPYTGMQFADQAFMLKGRWDAEFDADYFGLQYLYKAGFDPNCFINFIGRIARSPAAHAIAQINVRARPIAPERVKAMRKEVAKLLPRRSADVISSSEYDAVREQIRQLQLPSPTFKRSDGRARPPN